MFQTVFQSIIRSLKLYIHHQAHVIQVLWLLASGTEMELHLSPTSQATPMGVATACCRELTSHHGGYCCLLHNSLTYSMSVPLSLLVA